MSIGKIFLKIERSYAWGVYGLILAIGMFLYSDFYKDNSPKLKIELKSSTQILDVREDDENLRIFYGDEDIKTLKKTISIFIVNFQNDGELPILKEHFDKDLPLSLIISNGEILKLSSENQNSDYFKHAFEKIKHDKNQIIFPSMIINPGDILSLKFLVLQNQGEIIKISTGGKLAHIKKLEVADTRQEKEKNVFYSAFTGKFGIQIIRVISYPFILIILLILILFIIILPISSVSDYLKRKKVKNFILSYKSQSEKPIEDDKQISILKFYELNNLYSLDLLKKVLKSEHLIQKYLNLKIEDYLEINKDLKDSIIEPPFINNLETYSNFDIGLLIQNFLITNKISKPDDELNAFLEEFLRFVKIKEL